MECRVELLKNHEDLHKYLNDVDKDFGTPLSSKTDLISFASKLIKYGHVYVIKEGYDIVAMIGFYSNDTINNNAYLPILSTKDRARGKGYARKLVSEMIDICKKDGMKTIFCDSINPIAISLYISLGFNEYKKEENKSYLKLKL